MPFVRAIDDFRLSPHAAFFEGRQAGVEVSSFIIDHKRGGGPGLHTHPYAEVFVVLEGLARFTIGEDEVDVSGGHIAVVPPDTPHKFEALSDGLRQVTIHDSPELVQIELED
jgi:quercetin dioxygenase-like cupin family protein